MKQSTCPVASIDCGGTVPGSLGAGDCALGNGSLIDVYRLVLGRPDQMLLRAAASIRPTVQSFSPAAAVEIEAIAEGAGVDPGWIDVLNARSELMADIADGCTAVFDPEHGNPTSGYRSTCSSGRSSTAVHCTRHSA